MKIRKGQGAPLPIQHKNWGSESELVEGAATTNKYSHIVDGECTMSKTKPIEWFRRFNNSETSLDDQKRSGPPPSIVNIEALSPS